MYFSVYIYCYIKLKAILAVIKSYQDFCFSILLLQAFISQKQNIIYV